MSFGQRASAIFRRVPVWAYIALFLIGVGCIQLYERGIQAEAYRRYKQIVDNVELLPYAGVYWIINVYKVDRSLLPITRPFTTYDTYLVDVQPKGVDPAVADCSGPIRSIRMELLGPAFDVAPPYAQTRPIEDYCRRKTGSLDSTPIITWDVLAKQGGLHVAGLRIVGLDSNNKSVAGEDATIEVPIWVKDPSMMLAIGQGITFLGGLATLIAIVDRLKGRQISS
jgi:hypothetical protein